MRVLYITKLDAKHFKVQGSDDALLMTLHAENYGQNFPFISSESIRYDSVFVFEPFLLSISQVKVQLRL